MNFIVHVHHGGIYHTQEQTRWVDKPFLKYILMMKLTCIFMVAFNLYASASVFGQKVNISVKNVPLKNVMQQIQRQTGYSFFIKETMLKDAVPVTLSARNKELPVVLSELFKSQPFTFRLEGKVITALPRPSSITLRHAEESMFIEEQDPIRGRVVDEYRQPLEGASVWVLDEVGKRSRTQALTDRNGNFQLEGISEGTKLEVAYLGYASQVVSASRQLILVTLKAFSTEVDQVEVVVNTGFQVLNKERATGSFGTVDSSQLDKPAISIAQRIIGTNAGVQARSMDVDGNPTFEIRGQSSLGATAAPLVVVDGFPIQGDYNSINPNDVESITILKDAAAASIWGARAANGVVVVVTKRGKKGAPLSVDFQAFTRVGSKFDLDYINPLASSRETVEYEKMSFNKWSAQENSGAFQTNYGKQWSLATIALSEHHLGYITEAERDAELARLQTLDNRGQIRDLLLSNPVNQQYNLSMAGGTERMVNRFSLLYERNQSNFKETKNNRYLLNYNTSASILKWLDFNASAMLQYRDATNNGVSLTDIQGLSPYELLQNEDGSSTNIHRYYWPIMERFVPMELFPYSDWTYNPIQEMQNRDLSSTELNARLMGGITIRPLSGLSFDSKVQYETFNSFNRNLYNENTFEVRRTVNQATGWNQTTNEMVRNLPMGSILDQNRGKVENWNFRNQINFNRSIGVDHEINAIAGSEINNRVIESFGYPRTYGYNDETLTLGNFPNGPGGTFKPIQNWLGNNQTFAYTNSFGYRTERYISLFANAAYTYSNKYTLSGSIRTDASNMITDDPSYRYAPFWSLGGAWQLGKEKFMDNVDWVNRLNLRLTYGYNGNVDPTTAFRPLISTTAVPNVYTDDFTANISSFGNPTLRWERTGTWNLGVDYTILNGRLHGKIDVYNKYGKDLIAQLSIPAINGTTSQKLNNAEMFNRGIEIELGTVLPIKGRDVTWRGSLNFSYNKNEITRLFIANYAANNLYAGTTASYVEGYDANSMWMFEYAGVHDTQPMIYGADGDLYDFGAWTPGDGRNFMLNMGTKVAPYTLGFMNAFKVYDFDFSFIVTGKFGHVFKKLPFNYPPTWGSRVLPNVKLGEVMNGNPNEIVPLPLNDIEPRYYFWDRFHQHLSYHAASASHIRMQEINATYHLPVKRWGVPNISRAMFYVQGNDLFTVLFNDAGEDPEYMMGTMNPRPKFTLGLKVGF